MRTQQLPRKPVYVDAKGRIVIPKYMRDALGIKKESWVDIETYPNLEECKGLLIKKT